MKKNLLLSIATLLFLPLAWFLFYLLVGNGYILPSPWETLLAMGTLFAEGSFYLALFNTLWRTLLAFVCSLVLGVGLALCAALWSGVRACLAPVVSVLRTLPTMAFALALLIWTTPRFAPVFVSFLVLFPAIYAQALYAFDGVGEEYGRLFRAYGVSKGKQVARGYLPLAAPAVLSQVGSYLSMGLKVTVSAEVLSLTYRSLGGMLTDAQTYLEMPRLFALTVCTLLLGFALEGICALVKKAIVRWQK